MVNLVGATKANVSSLIKKPIASPGQLISNAQKAEEDQKGVAKEEVRCRRRWYIALAACTVVTVYLISK